MFYSYESQQVKKAEKVKKKDLTSIIKYFKILMRCLKSAIRNIFRPIIGCWNMPSGHGLMW